MDICCGRWGEKKIINLKFCKLTVLAEAFEDRYKCHCDCGRSCYVSLDDLVIYRIMECLQCSMKKTLSLRLSCSCGETFNYTYYDLFALNKSLNGKICDKCMNLLCRIRKMDCYRIWIGCGDRCNNPNNKSYYLYGGRGIRRCSRWDSLINFYNDMGEKPKGMQLDRIDPDGDYCKENCRWVTPKENMNNRRCSKKNRDKYIMVKIETLKEYLPENILNKLGIKT